MIQVATNPSGGANRSISRLFNRTKSFRKAFILYRTAFLLMLFPTLIQAQNCSVNANVDASYCANVPIQLAGVVSSGVSAYSPPMTWTQVGGPSVLISNPNITNPAIIGAAPNQIYTFRLTIRCEDNESVFDEVKITVKPISIALIGADATYCPGTYSVTGNTPVNSGETVLWQIIGNNGAGLSISNSTSATTSIILPPTSAGSTTLRYTIINPDGCQSFDDLVITNRGGAQAVNAGSDQNIASNVACYSVSTCVNLNGTFEGNGTSGQTTTWSQVSGPTIGTFNNVSIPNPQVCNLKQGTYVFRLTATGPCSTGSDDVTIIIPAPSQSITGVAGMPDISFCDGRTSVVLNGTPPSYTGETVQWTIVNNGGGSPVIASPTSPTTTVTGLTSGAYYQFRYTITNAATGCSTTGTVQVYNQTPPTINAGVDQVLACGVTTATIPYTQGGGLFTQYQIISGPTGVMGSPAGASSSPQVISGLNASGDYIIRFTRNSSLGSTCQTATDDIKITVSLPASASNAGTDQSLACGVTFTNLAGNTFSPSLGIGRWSQISGPSLVTIANVFANNTLVSMSAPGDYTFRWTIDNGPNCPKNFDDVVVVMRTPPVSNAGTDQNPVCYNTAVQLRGSIPAQKQVGTWTVVGQVPTGTSPTFSNINNPLAKLQGLNPNTTYKLLWTINSIPTGPGNCTSASDTIVVGTNTSVGPGDANAGVDICVPSGNTTATFAATALVQPNTGLWTNVSKPTGSATPGFSPNANQVNTQATGLQAGTYKFVWTITDGVCTSNDTMQVTVNSAIPTASAGANQTLCGTSTTLNGNSAGAGIGKWTEISGPAQANIVDVNNPTTAINSLVPGDYVFRWTITNGSCGTPTTSNVTIKVSESISLANIVATSVEVCPTATSTTLTADAINAASQGAWSVVGNAPSAVSFSAPTNPVTTVSGLIQGNYKFRWTVSGGINCPITTDDIDVFVQESSNAGLNQNICLSNSALLTGNGPSGTWLNISGPNTPTLTPTGSPSNAVNVSGLVSGTYVFGYTIIKNPNAVSCPNPSQSQVTVSVSAAGSTPNAGLDKQVCEGTAINLNNADVLPNPVPSGQTGLWTILSQPTGSSNATLTNATSPSGTLNIGTNSKYGLYLLKWTITNGSCIIGDEVRVENFQTPTVANAGVDKTVCPPTVKMTGNAPTVGMGMWTLVSKTPSSLPTPTIQNPQVATTDITGIDASGSYVFRWTISNGPCVVSSDDVVVNVPDPAPTTANAGADQIVCNATAVNINANTPTVGTGTWSKTPDSPYSVFSPASGTSPATTALSLTPGTYKYIWTITSGICISRDTLIISNLAVPTTANAGVDQIVCQFSPVNLNATVPTAGTGTWTQISKPAGNSDVTFISPNSPTSQVVGTGLGQYTFRWTVSTGVNSPNDCQTSTDDVIVNIVASPTPATAGASQTICEGSTLTLDGNVPTVGTGTWTKVGGPVGSPEIITNVNNPKTTVTGLLAGTYKYRWTIGASGNCTSFDEMTVTVRPKPMLSSATPSCVGGAGMGAITITGATNPMGGTLNYALNAGAFQVSNIFSNLTNGAYTITIKDVTTSCTNSITTNVSCNDNPVIGVAKSAGTPTLVTNGVYDVPYTITVKNLGNVALSNVQVTDNLTTTFPSPTTYSITLKSTALPLIINTSFDGNTNQNLLNSTSSTLVIGGVQTISFTVRVNLNGSTQTLFNNSATAGATNPSGLISSPADISNNGGTNAIDPNGNGNPRDFGEDAPTPVSITNGNIGVAKTAGTPLKISDGVYDVPYTIVVKNIGNVTLTGVQVSDNLSITFPLPATYTISQTPQTLAPLTAESTYNGTALSANLLLVNGTNTSTLTAGQSRTITFTVRVTLNGSTQTTFNNQATAAGINPSAQTVTDLSNNGVETAIDPNSNGYAGDIGENTPTPVTISNPIIGVAKSVIGSPTLQADGSYNVVYQVITKNFGNVTLNNVQVTENLTNTFPSPITYNVVSKTGAGDLNAGFLGTPSAQNLLTGTGTLAANASNTYTFTTNIKLNGYTGINTFLNNVNASGTGILGGSTSDVSNDGTDPTPTGNTPTPVTIQNQADLSLAKTVSKTNPNVGENITYTITVLNAGPNTATNVEVKDVLPAGLQFVSSSTLTNVSGTLTATIASIAVNSSASVTFVAKVLAVGITTNAAEVSKADQPDLDSPHGNGTANSEDDRASVNINAQQADLSLTKAVSKTNPNVGENITYTITVTNAGPSTATNVLVKDILPAGLTFVSSSNFTNTSGTLLSNNIAIIASGASTTLTFVATVTQAGAILNKAEIIGSDQYDPDSQPNTGTEDGQDDTGGVLIGGQQADLSLQKSVSNANPNVDDVVTYTITIANAGPSTATGVTIEDILPTGLQFVASPTLTNNAGTITNTIPLTVNVGTPISLTFTAKILTPISASQTSINNKAEIKTTDQFDPDSQPNTGTTDGQDDTGAALLIIQTADLSIKKNASPLSVNVGDNVTYSITLSNAGLNTATNVQMQDLLPMGLQFVSSTDFTAVGQTLTASSLTIASGTSKTLTYIAKVTASGALKNVVQITKSDQYDPDSQPNSGTSDGQDDTDNITIAGKLADLSIVKTASQSVVNPNDIVTYSITVSNAGPNAVNLGSITDALPAGLQFISSTTLINSGGTLTGNFQNLLPNTTTTFTYQAKVIGTGNITNKSQISGSDVPDPDSTPNNGTDNGEDDTYNAIIRVRQADLELTKTASKTNPNVGENITYTITVINKGIDDATNVKIKDILPAGLSFVSSLTFVNTAGTLISNNIASITAGGQITLTFIATVTQAGAILNRAEVLASDQFDPDSQPNTGTNDGQDDTGGVLIGGQQADLSLTKTVSNALPNVGDSITYSITVTNAGPSTATGVEIRDVLPVGLSFINSTDFTNTLGTLTASNLTLAVGTPKVLTFTAKVTGNQTIINKAEVSKSDQFDPDSQPNTGTADGQDDTGNVSITPQIADLSLTKTVSNNAPNVNSNVIYTINVTNAGPDIATNVEIKDVLPAGLQFISSTGTPAADLTNSAGTLTGTVGAIAVGATKSFTFMAKVLQTGAILNKAEVSKSDQFDIDSQPNTGTADGQDDTGGVLIGGQQADLSLKKAVSNTTPNVGDVVTYTITVNNAGPSIATNVEIKDALLAGLQFVSSTDFINFSGTLTSTIPSLPVGNKVLTYTAKIIGNQAIKNKVEVSKSDQYDPNSQPNTGTQDGQDDTDSVRVVPKSVDLSLIKLVSKTNPNVGEIITYTVQVANAGPDAATNVQVKDVLPAGLQFVSSTDFTNTSGVLLSNNIPMIAANSIATLTFTAKVTQVGAILNKAEVSKSDQFDFDSQPNTGTEDGQDDTGGVLIGGQQADLSLTKAVSNATPNVGETITYTITVNNAGPSTATGVEVKDVLPFGLDFIGSTDFTNTLGTLTASNLTLAVGTPKVLTFTAKVTGNQTIINKAEVSKSDQFDPDSQPNTGTADGQDDTGNANVIPQVADLSLKKLASPLSANVGDNITYTIQVNNAGPSTATNVEVKDILPVGLTLVNAGNFTNNAGTLTATIPSLATGVTQTLTFVAKLTQAGNVTNAAEITKSDQFDTDSQVNNGTTNNEDDTDKIIIGGILADLSLSKTVNKSVVNLNENVEFTITVLNTGPNAVTSASVRDVLPTGLQFVSSSTLANTNGTLMGQISNLGVGQTQVFKVIAKVTGTGKITNNAEIASSSVPDPDSSPNNGTLNGEDDTDSTSVRVRTADLSLTKFVNTTTPNVDEIIEYTILINNAGTDAATNVQAKDLLPAGLQFISSSDFVLSGGNLLLSNNIATIPANGNITLKFKAKVTLTGSILNKAEVSKSDQYDPDSQVNTGTEDGQDDTGGVLIGGQQADLSLTKTVSNSTPNVGDNVTYSITVTNAGPSTATNIEVQDILPAGLQFVSSTDFNNINGKLTGQVASLTSGTPKVLTFTAKVTGNQTIINKAEVSKSDQFDPDSQVGSGTEDGQDDTGAATLTPQSADLSLLKTVSKTNPTVGETITYTIGISNAGANIATGVTVKDSLPTGLQFMSSTDFINTSGILTASNLVIAIGATKILTFQAKVTQAGAILNKAEVSKSDQFDPDSQPNTGVNDGQDDTGGVLIGGQQADLSLQKTVSNTKPNVGDNIIYTITVNNIGPNNATNVEVKDVLPVGLQFINSNDFQLAGNTLTSQITSLPIGNKVLTFVAKVTGNQSITNKAEISKADQFDPDSKPSNGTENGEDDQDRVTISPKVADLSLVKTVSNPKINVGDAVTFTLTVTNIGPDTATNVRVKDILPLGLELLSPVDFTDNSGALISKNIVQIAPNGTFKLSFTAKITKSGAITNKAEIIASDQFDPDSQPNTGTEDGQDDIGRVILNGQQADLSLQKQVSNISPVVGEILTYTIKISNAGPNKATNVQIQDVLPAGLVFLSSVSFINTNGTLIANLDSVNVGQVVPITFQVKNIALSGTLTNKAQITKSDQFDPDSSPNNGTENGEDDTDGISFTTQAADLSIVKTVSAGPYNVGDNVTFTITVKNNGPSLATNVVISDSLPNSLSFVSGNGFINTNGKITAGIGSLGVGVSQTLTVIAKVTKSGTSTNTGIIVKSDQFDPIPQNNRDSVSITTQKAADLSLRKTVSNQTPTVGSNATFTIFVKNAGPDLAQNVRVKDYMPVGLEFVSSGDFTLLNDGNLQSNNISTITVNDSVALVFVARITQSANIINKAEISKSDTYDPDSQPNTGTSDGQDDTGGVILNGQQADLSLRKDIDNANPNVGDVVTYTIRVTNAGPNTATNVQVQDILPAGLALVSLGNFTNIGNTLTADLANIGLNETKTLIFSAKVLAPTIQQFNNSTITNKAQITKSDQYDPDSQPNSGTEDGQDDTDDASINIQQADLSLRKTLDGATSVTKGSIVTYRLTVSNAGPSLATNIEVKDVLPQGLELINSTDFANNGGTLIGKITSLAAGTAQTLSFVAKITQAGNVLNTAEISKSDQFDPDSKPGNGTNNTEDDRAEVSTFGRSADLSLTKTVSDSVVTPLQTITYTISVKNTGPDAVGQFSVKDYLPVGIEFISSKYFTNSASTLSATIFNVKKDSTVKLTFLAKVKKTVLETISTNNLLPLYLVNKTEITDSDTPDPDSQPNNGTGNGEDDTDEVKVRIRMADLSLRKLVTNPNPQIGQNFEYKLVVRNDGPDFATNVQVRDILPDGLTFVSSNDFSNNNGVLLSKNMTKIDNGKADTLRFTAKTTQTGNITNRAEISKSDQLDPDSEPNNGLTNGEDDEASVTIGGQSADLSLLKSVDNLTPNIGDIITYTIAVKNAGSSPATNVQVQDYLPRGLQFMNGSPTTNNFWSMANDSTLLSNIIPQINANTTINLTLKVRVTAAVLAKGFSIKNYAEVFKSDQYDPDSQPNTGYGDGQDDADEAEIKIQYANLKLDKTVSNRKPRIGEEIDFTFTVTNEGVSNATNVEVKDILPKGLQYILGNGWTKSGDTLKSKIDIVNSGTSRSIVMRVKVTSPGSIINLAEISKADQFDPNSPHGNGTGKGEDDESGVSINGEQADLSLTKTVSNKRPNVGNVITYSISVRNAGPDAATNVEVKDKLPKEIEFIQSDDFDNVSSTLYGQIRRIGKDSTLTLTFTAKITQPTAFTNRAEISKSDQYDPDSQPNTGTKDGQDDTGGVTVTPRIADLSLQKLVDKKITNTGTNVTYKLVVKNAGPDSATNVVVKDFLPTGLEFISSLDFTKLNDQILASKVISVAPNSADTLRFVARVTKEGMLMNRAEIIKSDVYDPDSKPNTGTEDGEDDNDRVTIGGEQADLSLKKTVADQFVNVGKTTTFTIKVNNAGPTIATNVQVKDYLPKGLIFVSTGTSASTDFVKTNDSLLTSKNIASIGVNQTVSLTLVAQVTKDFNNPIIINRAEITKSDQFDPDSQPNTGTEDDQDDQSRAIITVPTADLSLKKIVNKPSASVGSEVIYTITVTNDGNDNATNVELKDYLPKGLGNIKSTDFTTSKTGDTLTLKIGRLNAGDSKTFTYTATILPTANSQKSITNKVEITRADQFDPDSPHGNGTGKGEDDEAEATVGGESADLEIKKTVSNRKPNVGENIIYTITVKNNGPSKATNVEVKDYLPEGLAFVNSNDFRVAGTILTAKIDSIKINEIKILTVTTKLLLIVDSQQPIINKVVITNSDQFDPNTKNNKDSVSIGGKSIDLSLIKLINKPNANLGEQVTYKLIVKNMGADTATNVVLRDALPASLGFVTSTDFTMTGSALISRKIARIAPNRSDTLLFIAKVKDKGMIMNCAEVFKADQFDIDSQAGNGTDNGEDDEACAMLNGDQADLSLSKGVDGYATTPNVGDTLTYVLEVRNAGPGIATKIQVSDVLPKGISFISSKDFTKNPTTSPDQLVSKTIDSIKVGSSVKLKFKVKVTSVGGEEVANTIINRAEITKADQFDPDSQPNTGTADGQDDVGYFAIMPQISDLNLKKNVSNRSPSKGQTVDYTLTVYNAGPAMATNVEVRDILPSGLTFVSSMDFSLLNGTSYIAKIPAIAAGTSQTVTLVARVTTNLAIINKAEISKADQFDPNSPHGNGTDKGEDDESSVTINAGTADLSLTKIVNHTDVTVGDTLLYMVQVNNVGPAEATNVEIADILPDGLVLIQSNNGTLVGNIITFKVPIIDKKGFAVFSYKVLVTKVGSLVNKAQVIKSDQSDPNSMPNNGKWDGKEDDEASCVVRSKLPCNKTAPNIIVSKPNISCQDSTSLTASGCMGTVNWSDGKKGNIIIIRPTTDVTMTATCIYSSTCVSDVSRAVKITVTNPVPPVILVNKLQVCGGDSVKLSSTGCVGMTVWSNGRKGNLITEKIATTSSFTAVCRIGTCDSPISNEVTIKAGIEKPLVICGKERLCVGESEVLKAIGCETGKVTWSDGQIGQQILVKPTKTQYQFTAICEMGTCKSEPSTPAYFIVTDCGKDSTKIVQKPMLALCKEAQIPVLVEGKTYDIIYDFRLVNIGNIDFEQIQLVDNLDAVFTDKGAKILKIKGMKADTGLVVNSNFDGRLNNQLLIETQSHLLKGKVKSLQFTVSVDFTNVKVDSFYNSANTIAKAGKVVVKDVSNNGFDVNPDGDYDPTNDSKPTPIRILSIQKTTDELKEIFIPEGFSPNGDGVNDLFTILLQDKTLTINLQIYNRWGGLVYASEDYQNNWDGTASQGANPTGRTGLPDGTYFYMVRLSNGKELVRSMTLMR